MTKIDRHGLATSLVDDMDDELADDMDEEVVTDDMANNMKLIHGI
jgi:hypothetical protein